MSVATRECSPRARLEARRRARRVRRMVGVAHDCGWQPCGSLRAVNKWKIRISSCRPTSTGPTRRSSHCLEILRTSRHCRCGNRAGCVGEFAIGVILPLDRTAQLLRRAPSVGSGLGSVGGVARRACPRHQCEAETAGAKAAATARDERARLRRALWSHSRGCRRRQPHVLVEIGSTP